MTTAVGYPDWVRSFATSRFFAVLAFATTFTQQTVLGPFTTANIDSIGFRLFSQTGHGFLTISWFQDEAGTQLTTAEEINLREGDSFDFSIVVKGPFLKVTINNVEPADWTITLVLYETTRSVIPQVSSRANILIRSLGAAVGAGITVDVDANRLWPGPALWVVRSTLATWQAALQHVNSDGTARTFDRIFNTDLAWNHNLFLAAEHIRGQFSNTTGAAGSFDMFLLAQPGLAGL